MSLLRHFAAADLRRYRLAIAVWIFMVVVEAAIEQWVVSFSLLTQRGETIRTVSWFIWLAGLLLGCALVPLVLQLHPAVGTEAFWMTRPLPVRTLVASKLLLLAVVYVGVRVLVEAAVMKLHNVPGRDLALVGMQTALTRSLVLAGLLVVAVLTQNFARFVLLCVVLLFGFALLPVLLMLITSFVGSEEPAMLVGHLSYGSSVALPFPAGDETRTIVGVTLLIAGGLAVVGIQYAARRASRSIAAAVAAVIIAIAVSSYWPWSLSAAGTAPDWSQSPSSVQLSVDATAIRPERLPAWQQSERLSFMVPVRMTPAAPGWLATMRSMRASFDLGEGQNYSAVTGPYPAVLPDPAGREPLDLALQHALGVPVVVRERFSAQTTESGLRVRLPGDVLSDTASRTGAFAGEFDVDIAKLDVAAVRPIGPSSFADGAYRLVIDDVREYAGGVAFSGRLVTVATIFDRRPRPAYTYVLRNRSRGEAVVGSAMSSRGHVPFPGLGGFSISVGRSAGFWADAQIISFGGYDPTQPTRIAVDREWLDGAELVIVRATHEGSIRRTLEIRDFPLSPPAAATPPR